MALKILFRILFFALLPAVTGSCEKEVTLDLADREGAYLIVEGNLDDASPEQWIRLSRSSSYYDVSTGSPVENAFVTVNDGDKDYVFAESSTDSLRGYYFNREIGGELKESEYYLTIVHDDNIYTGQSEFRPVPDIDSITFELNFFSRLGFTDDTLYDVYIHFSELPLPGDHYLVDIDINGRLQTGRPSEKTVFSDEDLEEYVSLSVRTINGDNLEQGDTITMKLRSISKEQYEFYQVFFFQTDLSGNPFAGAPPANIPTNMSEGAHGFFQVSSVSPATVEFISPGR
ncbi:MAG: DUF4249 domain-containing protein [Bacteroidales bacterium]